MRQRPSKRLPRPREDAKTSAPLGLVESATRFNQRIAKLEQRLDAVCKELRSLRQILKAIKK